MRCRCDERSAIRSGARGGVGEAMSCVMKGYIMIFFDFDITEEIGVSLCSILAPFPPENKIKKFAADAVGWQMFFSFDSFLRRKE